MYYEETVNTKFLGLQIDNHINWKNHTLHSLNHASWYTYVRSTNKMHTFS